MSFRCPHFTQGQKRGAGRWILQNATGMQNRDKRALSEWMINGPVKLSLLFLARALCPFVPTFREMAGVPLALMDDATELISALRCFVLFLTLRISRVRLKRRIKHQ